MARVPVADGGAAILTLGLTPVARYRLKWGCFNDFLDTCSHASHSLVQLKVLEEELVDSRNRCANARTIKEVGIFQRLLEAGVPPLLVSARTREAVVSIGMAVGVNTLAQIMPRTSLSTGSATIRLSLRSQRHR